MYALKTMERDLVAFLVLVFALHKQVAGVKCYVCESLSNPACGDIFTLSENSKDFVRNCRTSCYKFTASRADNRDISRGCLPSTSIFPHCKNDRIGDLYGKFCACNDDLCNGVTTAYIQYLSYMWTGLICLVLRLC